MLEQIENSTNRSKETRRIRRQNKKSGSILERLATASKIIDQSDVRVMKDLTNELADNSKEDLFEES